MELGPNIELVVLMALAAALWLFKKPSRYQRHRWRPRVIKNRHSEPGTPDFREQQMQAVERSHFNRKRLMSAGEYSVYRVAKEVLGQFYRGNDYLLFPQVSLGEVLRTKSHLGRSAINSKRVDFVIVDKKGYVMMALEYQGSGHYLNRSDTLKRDHIKRMALEKAGIVMLEVPARFERDQLRKDILGVLSRHADPKVWHKAPDKA